MRKRHGKGIEMKEQKIVAIGISSPTKEHYEYRKEYPYIPMALPLEDYFSAGWQIVSYQLCGAGHSSECFAVVLFEREKK